MKSLDNIEKLIQKANAQPSAEMKSTTLKDIFKAQEESNRITSAIFETNLVSIILGRTARYLAVVFLIVSSLVICFVLSRKNADLRDELELARRNIATAPNNDSVTINFYLRKHQDFIARQATLNSVTLQPSQIRVSQHDIMYFELLRDRREYMTPGIIVRRPSYQREISLPKTPAISNGYTLTLSEAEEVADFDLVSPSWLRPCYRLDQIRKIEGHDAIQLLYTDDINSVSLFEQPLDGRYRLESKDIREYAIYLNQEQAGTTILAWRDNRLSYILIGNTEMSQLMDIAQLINATK